MTAGRRRCLRRGYGSAGFVRASPGPRAGYVVGHPLPVGCFLDRAFASTPRGHTTAVVLGDSEIVPGEMNGRRDWDCLGHRRSVAAEIGFGELLYVGDSIRNRLGVRPLAAPRITVASSRGSQLKTNTVPPLGAAHRSRTGAVNRRRVVDAAEGANSTGMPDPVARKRHSEQTVVRPNVTLRS